MLFRSHVAWMLSALASAAISVGACSTSSGGGGNNGPSCIPGASVTCACVGSAMGAQICNADGHTYSMCQCSVTPGMDSGSPGMDSGGSMDSGGTMDVATDTPVSTDAPVDACATRPRFAGKATMQQGSLWTYQAQVGLPAGNAMCQALGADHACDYDDIVVAAARGDLTTLTATDTAWLQRTHAVTQGGVTYQVGPGSRCAEWNYATDHTADGEFVSFENGGATPTYHLDDDPNAIQPGAKLIPCGHNALLRNVLCCFAKCP